MEAIAFLTHQGLIIPVGILKNKFKNRYQEFLDRLTVTYHPKIGASQVTKLYSCETFHGIDCIRLPRTLLQTLLKGNVILRVEMLLTPVSHTDVDCMLELYNNQKVLVDHLCGSVYTADRMAAGTACAMLNLRAGMGKTFVAAGIIGRLKLRTLYIVPNRALQQQACGDLALCFSNGVGPYSKKGTGLQNITVIVVDSALRQCLQFFAGYHFIVYDEVHAYCSPVKRQIFARTVTACLGMSATTSERANGLDAISHRELAFDGVIFAKDIPGFTMDNIEFKSEVEIIHYNAPPEYSKALTHPSTGKLFTPLMNKQFIADPFRTKLVMGKIVDLYNWQGPGGSKHCIYVFCEEREPLIAISGELKKILHGVYAPELTEVGTFIGGVKEEEAAEMRDNARILLTTYGYSGKGISINRMTAIVFLTPRRSNMLQILARILRRDGDQSVERKIVDIVDNRTPIKSQLASRKMAYNYYQMSMTQTKVNYNEL